MVCLSTGNVKGHTRKVRTILASWALSQSAPSRIGCRPRKFCTDKAQFAEKNMKAGIEIVQKAKHGHTSRQGDEKQQQLLLSRTWQRVLEFVNTPTGKASVLGGAVLLRWALLRLRTDSKLRRSVLDTRFMGWIVENGSVWSLCYVRSLIPNATVLKDRDENGKKVPWREKIKTICKNILLAFAGCIVAEEGAVLLLHLLSTRVYGHVPYFVEQKRSANPFTRNGLRDWLDGNAYLQVLGGGIALGILESFTPKWLEHELDTEEMTLGGFLRNFAIFRFVVDIVFYLGHRTMHSNQWWYQNIHKRHHGHFTTNLATNYHFSAPDLFIETALPMFTAMMAIRGLGYKLGRFELHLFMIYMSWYDNGTHLGKPLQLISMYPPLSFLYNPILPLDMRAVEFHETHHNRRDANYGITSWIDKLVGTEEFAFNRNVPYYDKFPSLFKF